MKKLRIVFLCCLFIIATYDLLAAYGQSISQFNDHTTVLLHSLSIPFRGLEVVFKNIPVVGYYTDKDMADSNTIAQYEQAQYALAPTVLDLTSTQHQWVLVVCSGPQAAIKAMKQFGLVPLKMNQGIILAANPHATD